jgi:hypothetical protein
LAIPTYDLQSLATGFVEFSLSSLGSVWLSINIHQRMAYPTRIFRPVVEDMDIMRLYENSFMK